MQRTKDMKLEELTVVREHENACLKLKHQLELSLKRDKVTELTVLCRNGVSVYVLHHGAHRTADLAPSLSG